MAWRFGQSNWIEKGQLDNRIAGKTIGELVIAEVGLVKLELTGNMRGDLQGHVVDFTNEAYAPDFVFDHGPRTSTAGQYMDGFDPIQRGEVGDVQCAPYFYLEWYSSKNGRCVIELPEISYKILGE